MAPGLQIVFSGSYAPDAPSDMFAGIGKNGQIVSISKSKGIVFVRMGDAPDSFGEVPTEFCNEIWIKLNAIMCNVTSTNESQNRRPKILIYPNPANTMLTIDASHIDNIDIEVINIMGETILNTSHQNTIDISGFKKGIYIIKIKIGEDSYTKKIVKQ